MWWQHHTPNLCSTQTPGRQPHPDRQLRQDPRSLILRHGAPCPVPAMQDVSSEGDTMIHSDSPEVHQLLAKRSGMTQRLLQLRDAGLPTQFALAMFRYAIAGDATFLARTCGIPPRAQIDLDHITTRTACALLHADDITETTRQRIFLPTRLGGLGVWSAIATARAAFTASWIATLGKLRQWTRKSTQELGLSSVLRDIQDYAEHTNEMDINTETLHTMALKVNQRSSSQVNIEKVYEQISNPWQVTSGQQLSSCLVEVQGRGRLHFHPELHVRRWTTNRSLWQPDFALGFRWAIMSHTATKVATITCAAPNSMNSRPTL